MKKFLKLLYKYKYIIIPGILGMISFILIYDIGILDPTNIDWILSKGGDITQHYLGWEFYRMSDWTFPIGMNSVATFPFSLSVIFTDSIPLFSVIFKIFSGILPSSFQFIGLYGLLCFILQGVTGSIVLKKFVKNDYIIILMSLFLIWAPVVIYRMFYHTSLSSHFLIFLAMILVLYKDKWNLKKTMLFWALLGVLCASIHIYFLLIDGIILLGYMLYEFLTTKNIKKVIGSLLSFLIGAALTVFVLGGFSLPYNPLGENTIATFNFNLNGFINPFGYSKTYETLATPENFCQEEGFAYLGLGLIVLVAIAIITSIIVIIYRLIKSKKIVNNKKLLISIILVSLISLIVATAPHIYFGDKLIFEYTIPDFVQKFVGFFRSNGRIIWPMYYIIIFGTFYIVSKFINKKILFIVLIVLFGLQVDDMENQLRWRKEDSIKYNYNIDLSTDDWDRLFQDDFKHLILPTDLSSRQDYYYYFSTLVIKYNKTLNRFNIAQDILYDQIDYELKKSIKNIKEEDLYIIDMNSIFAYMDLDANYYQLDDLFIVTKKQIDYLAKADFDNIKFWVNSFARLKLNENRTYQIHVTCKEELSEDNITIYNTDFEIINNEITFQVQNQSELLILVSDLIVDFEVKQIDDIIK